MAPGVLHPIFDCSCAFAKPAVFEFPREKVATMVGRTAGGGEIARLRTNGELSSACNIAYMSFHCCGVNSLCVLAMVVLHEQTHIVDHFQMVGHYRG